MSIALLEPLYALPFLTLRTSGLTELAQTQFFMQEIEREICECHF